MSGRVLFYVQHLLGVGHLKRAQILAEALAGQALDVMVALGAAQLPEVSFANVKVAELPSARIAGEDFSTLLDAAGKPVDESWRATRRASLLRLAGEFDPDVILLELFPFGRRQFCFELIPLLEAVQSRSPRPRVVCSVRDVLVASGKPSRNAEIVGVLRRFFDAVLVHGNPALIPFGATFAAADEIADLIRYTGYVTTPAETKAAKDGRGEVLVSAGGGAVGAPLLFAALKARPLTPLAGHVWRFLAGPNLPDDLYGRLAAAAGERTVVERFRPDFPARLKAAALSISQGGYNTTMDILSAGVRAVVVPYEIGGETEQRMRSEILAAKGLLRVLPAAELSPESLAASISAAWKHAAPAAAGFNLDGAARAADIIARLAAQRSAVHAKFESC